VLVATSKGKITTNAVKGSSFFFWGDRIRKSRFRRHHQYTPHQCITPSINARPANASRHVGAGFATIHQQSQHPPPNPPLHPRPHTGFAAIHQCTPRQRITPRTGGFRRHPSTQHNASYGRVSPSPINATDTPRQTRPYRAYRQRTGFVATINTPRANA